MSETSKLPARAAGPIDRFLSTFSLVSRIPVRAAFVWDASRLDFHLPLVGLPVALLSAVCLLGPHAFGVRAMFCALICLGVQYFAFNLFHLDGLLDSADALLCHADKEKRLAILKDSRIGVFAFFVGFLYLSFKVTLLVEILSRIDARGAWAAALFFAYPIAGRAAGALLPTMSVPARSDGLGAKASGAKAPLVVSGTALALVFLTFAGFVASSREGSSASAKAMIAVLFIWPITALVAAASAGTVARWYNRSIGGYTGDAQGAAVEIGEVLYLTLAVFVSESGY